MPVNFPSAEVGGSGVSQAVVQHALCCYDTPTATPVTVGTTVTPLCPPNPNRQILQLSSLEAATTIVVLFTPKVSLSNGIQIAGGSAPLQFNRIDHGPLVTLDWYAISSAAGRSMTVIDISLKCGGDDCHYAEFRKLLRRNKRLREFWYGDSEGFQPNFKVDRNYGFATSRLESPENWVDILSSKRQSFLDSVQRVAGRSGRRTNGISSSESPYPDFGLRLNDQG